MLQRRASAQMREMSVREANRDFSQVIAAVERGETILITKNGKPVARIAPVQADCSQDRERQAAREALAKSLREKPATSFRVGKITEDDKYGD